MHQSDFYRAMLAQSAVVRLLSSVRLSVCPSVTIRYRVQILWNSSKIISGPNSLRSMCSLTPNMGDLVQREHPQNWRWIGVGQEHIKPVRSPKRCKIGPRLLLRTNRKSHMRFWLAPISVTLDDLQRPKRHSWRNKQNFRSLNSFRIKIRAKYSDRKREQN